MRFDFHVHTNLSYDSDMTTDEAVAAAKAAGLSGIAIADHNVFMHHCSREGIYIIPACEFSTDIGHLLVLFLKEQVNESLTRDDCGRFYWPDICREAHKQGALVFFAHPYAPPRPHSKALYENVDGIEAFNGRVVHSRLRTANERALELTRSLCKPYTVGSDAHCPDEVGRSYLELDLPESAMNEPDFEDRLKEAILAKRGRVFTGSAPATTVFKCKCVGYRNERLYGRLFKTFARYTLAAIKSPFVKQKKGEYLTVYTEEQL